MTQRKNSFRHESLQDGESISDLLNALTEGLAKGKLNFSDDEDEMLMEPKGLLNLKLKASQEEGRHRVDIRISWQVKDKKTKKSTLSLSTK